MRCSLLTLSTYLDDELSPDRRSEVEAHLIGCQRCRNGAGYLEEEVNRIGGLARVHVPDSGVSTLMQQLGLIGPDDPLPARSARIAAARRDDIPPWLRGGTGRAALPWAPPSKFEDPGPSSDRNQPALPFADVPLSELQRTGPPAPVFPTVDEVAAEPEVEIPGRAFLNPEPVIVPEPAPAPVLRLREHPGDEAAPPAGGGDPAPDLEQHPSPTPSSGAGFMYPSLEEAMPPAMADAAPAHAETEPAAPPEPWSPAGDIDMPPAPTTPDPVAESAAPVPPPPALEPTLERPQEDWSAWLPQPDVPAATTSAPPVAPPQPPPQPPRAEDATRRPVPHLDDMDDDAWSWAPRDHEQPVPPSSPVVAAEAVAGPGPGVDPWVAPDEVTDPLVDPVIARVAAQAPRPLRPSLFARARDLVAVRLALARRRAAGDDEVQIVSGRGAPERAAPQRRPSRRPRADDARRTTSPSIESAGPIMAATRFRGEESPPLDGPRSPWIGRGFTESADSAPASAEPPAETGLRQHGRHTRALSFRRSPLRRARLGGAREAMTAFGSTALERGRAVLVHPRQRWIALAGVVALLLVIVLGFRHTTEPTAGTAGQPRASAAASAAATPGRSTAAASAQSSPATPALTPAAAAPVAGPQSFGDGGKGWQIDKVRYGVHPGDYRIVFDMSAAGGSPSGSPAATVSFTDARTMLVTFSGVVPAGSVGSPTAGGVVTGATQTQGAGGQVVYRFTLSHPVTLSGQYLSNKLRLVLDLR